MQTLSIDNLLYEEIILLQNVMMYVENHTDFTHTLDHETQQIFSDLYDKIIQA